MRNTLLLLLILGLLAGVYFLFIMGSGGSSIRPEEHAFSVKNPELIQRIEMSKIVKEKPKSDRYFGKKTRWCLDGPRKICGKKRAG